MMALSPYASLPLTWKVWSFLRHHQALSISQTLFALNFFSLRQGLASLARLECSGAITAHYSLKFLSSSNPPTSASQVARTTGVHRHAWLIFKFFVEMNSHSVPQAACARFCVDICLQLSQVYAWEWTCWVIGQLHV